jgi:cytochrome b561
MAGTTTAPPRSSYTWSARTFHWTIAGLMAGMFITIWLRGAMERGSGAQAFWMGAHTSLGLLVFGLTVLRLLVRSPAPEPLGGPFAALLARAMHGALLAVTLLVPIAGFVRMAAKDRITQFFGYAIASPFGDAPTLYAIGRAVHGDIMQYIVLALIALHVAAAIGHHYVLRDDTLRRMT